MLTALVVSSLLAVAPGSNSRAKDVATFSIVAVDPKTGEVGVAVASRFFAVGSVVPWARGGVGAVATQANANTRFGPDALELMRKGVPPEQIVKRLTGKDPQASRRQLGLVNLKGVSATFTGPECITWAGGTNGPSFAAQGNILTGPEVIEATKKAFLETPGDLATRLYAALKAGDAAGGDSRGRQSAALIVAREGWGYNGDGDRYIDVRVDDHADPINELGRLVAIGRVNGLWNRAWTEFIRKQPAKALPLMEQTAEAANKEPSFTSKPEALYDLAVIRAAAGKKPEALDALASALSANPKLIEQARQDGDLAPLRAEPRFKELTAPKP